MSPSVMSRSVSFHSVGPAYPTAAAMRPQLGSRPKMALFTSEDPTTLFAINSASSGFAAPVTSHSMSTVAPSPSHAMVLARACSVTVSDSSSNLASALLASVMVTLPAAPLAMPITQSLVDVSPSTVIWLKLLMDAVRTISRQSLASTATSQVTTPSMVAMLGWIMPDPLAHPPIVISTPPIMTLSAVLLEARSVVVMAVAAFRPSSSVAPKASTSAGSAATISFILMRLPITPVDSIITSFGLIFSSAAIASADATASSHPGTPVAALAWPALIRMARMVSFSAMRFLQYVTGAAHTTFLVNAPPTTHGVSQ
mmetsp:Transcript_34535/g.58013  ORF Transcript_34535/g.58013 Transcript_34535/m.58013 type:complete len:313 (+) Transcript_34535:603-1541(+)